MTQLSFFLLVSTVSFVLPVLVVRLGKDYLTALLPIYLITGNVFAESFVTIFGGLTSLAVPVYAATFLITDILSEHYGKHDSQRAVWAGFMGQLVFLGMLLAVINSPVWPDKLKAFKDALGGMVRLVPASFLAYLVSQFLDVHLYHRIMEKTGKDKMIWLRNNAATMVAQFVDTTIFITIAFYGRPGFETKEKVFAFILTTWVFKSAVALFDTPFLYAARLMGKRRAL